VSMPEDARQKQRDGKRGLLDGPLSAPWHSRRQCVIIYRKQCQLPHTRVQTGCCLSRATNC
jgi:hypothetical protein